MAAPTRYDSFPLHAVGAIVSLLMFLIIGGCGGGTMGTQTGEQRVAVVGTAVGANGQSLAGVLVEIEDGDGNPIGQVTTDKDGGYAVEVSVASAADIVIAFTTGNGTTASAAVSVANVAIVTANFTVNNSGAPSVTIITTAPTPPPTQAGGGNTPTNTPVPPPGATNTPTPVAPTPTPQPLATKTPVVTPSPTPVEEPLICPKSEAVVDACCAYDFQDLNLFNPPLCKCLVNGSDRCVNVVAQYD